MHATLLVFQARGALSRTRDRSRGVHAPPTVLAPPLVHAPPTVPAPPLPAPSSHPPPDARRFSPTRGRRRPCARAVWQGKLRAGTIYGVFASGCLGVWAVVNLMSQKGIEAMRVVSVMGYSLIPIVLLAALSIFVDMRSLAGEPPPPPQMATERCPAVPRSGRHVEPSSKWPSSEPRAHARACLLLVHERGVAVSERPAVGAISGHDADVCARHGAIGGECPRRRTLALAALPSARALLMPGRVHTAAIHRGHLHPAGGDVVCLRRVALLCGCAGRGRSPLALRLPGRALLHVLCAHHCVLSHAPSPQRRHIPITVF